MQRLLSRTISLTSITCLQAGLWLLTIPSPPANATNWNQFHICVAELKRSNIAQEMASSACSLALEPKDLSLCVLKIDSQTPVKAEDALKACFKVRRPLDLADCVFDINEETEVINPDSVLNYCRRSLLPIRFSECVIGLSDQSPLPVAEAMTICLRAEENPRQLFPKPNNTENSESSESSLI